LVKLHIIHPIYELIEGDFNVSVKRIFVLFVATALCSATVITAVGLNGFVGGMRWNDVPATAIIVSTQGSLNSITRAYVSVILNSAQTLVTLGFIVHAPAVEQDSPVGAVLLLGNQEIGRWQHGYIAVYDDTNYSLRGAAWIPSATPANYYNVVLELGSKHAAAFHALQHLRLQLIDPLGRPSLGIDFPIITEQSESQTSAQTAPSPAQTTTTAPPLTFPPQPTTTTTQFTLPTLPATLLTTRATSSTTQPPQTQPDQFFTVTAWHTAIIENTAEPAAIDDVLAAQLTFAQPNCPPNISIAVGESIICPQLQFVQDNSIDLGSVTLAQALPASQNHTWLFVGGAGMLLLAVGLVIYWAKMRKAPPKEE